MEWLSEKMLDDESMCLQFPLSSVEIFQTSVQKIDLTQIILSDHSLRDLRTEILKISPEVILRVISRLTNLEIGIMTVLPMKQSILFSLDQKCQTQTRNTNNSQQMSDLHTEDQP